MDKPEKKPEYGGTHADVCMNIGHNQACEEWEPFWKKDRADAFEWGVEEDGG